MKRDKMLSSMGMIDEKYVEEAAPDRNTKRRSPWVRLGAVAACICLLVSSFAVWLFAPLDNTPPDVSKYSGSEYYALIKKINELRIQPRAYNNYELYFTDVILFTQSTKAESAVGSSDSNYTGAYVETTDNQVEGVIEADLIKRTDRHIFYLRSNVLSVYSIEKSDSRELASYTIDLRGKDSYIQYGIEAYLSEDGGILTVIMPMFSDKNYSTTVVSLDVSDPESIREMGRIILSGNYLSSRLSDGKLLMITNFSVSSPDFDDESTFVPHVETKDGKECIPMDGIVMPDDAASLRYTVLGMFDAESLSPIGNTAFMSYSQQVYVSKDSVYLTRRFTDTKESGNDRVDTAKTEIARLDYSDGGLTVNTPVTVDGYVKDQYSLDERNGILRVVTTTEVSTQKEIYKDEKDPDSVLSFSRSVNASLYCIDIATASVVAKVERFAPEGESVRSARFDGDTAYVCTSIQLSDPVFFFDLSDLGNITYKETGTIEGFSTSLVNFGDGYLLGIGVGSGWDTVKLEVYAEGEEKIESVCSYEVQYAYFSNLYKAYLIDRENSLVGLSINEHSYNSYKGNGEQYYLFSFDGESLTPIVIEPLPGYFDNTRAVYADGWLYMFSDTTFKVLHVN